MLCPHTLILYFLRVRTHFLYNLFAFYNKYKYFWSVELQFIKIFQITMKMEYAVAGIDIGGTTTTIGIITHSGLICWKITFLTQQRDFDTFLSVLSQKIEQARIELMNQIEIIGIGVGVPGGNYLHGTVQASNLNWGKQVNFVKSLSQYHKLPVALDNDANVTAVGEMHFGIAKNFKNFILITLGTGLGSGIVVDGKLVYGHDGLAGELGHICVEMNGRDCACGRKGCLETYVSATGIKRTVFELMANRTTLSPLREMSYTALTAQFISEMAESGDTIATEAFEITGKILGLKLADAIAHTSPEAIVFFGGLASAGKLLFEPTARYLKQLILPMYNANIPLLTSGLPGADAAILGAAALAWQKLEKSSKHIIH